MRAMIEDAYGMPVVEELAAPLSCTTRTSSIGCGCMCVTTAEIVDPHATPMVVPECIQSSSLRAATRATASMR